MSKSIQRRKSVRLSGYDYTQPGAYFVTLCTRNREHLFGEIIDGKMHWNDFGCIAHETWEWLTRQYPYVELDEWIVMPNHIHGMITIHSNCGRGRSRPASTVGNHLIDPPAPTVGNHLIDPPAPTVGNHLIDPPAPTFGNHLIDPPAVTIDDSKKRKPLGDLIGAFKTVSAKRINLLRKTPGVQIWQCNYYEHIIRSEAAWNRIRVYIVNNPLRWDRDKENILI
jgi:REP element-mobilizing transposase RayT